LPVFGSSFFGLVLSSVAAQSKTAQVEIVVELATGGVYNLTTISIYKLEGKPGVLMNFKFREL